MSKAQICLRCTEGFTGYAKFCDYECFSGCIRDLEEQGRDEEAEKVQERYDSDLYHAPDAEAIYGPMAARNGGPWCCDERAWQESLCLVEGCGDPEDCEHGCDLDKCENGCNTEKMSRKEIIAFLVKENKALRAENAELRAEKRQKRC